MAPPKADQQQSDASASSSQLSVPERPDVSRTSSRSSLAGELDELPVPDTDKAKVMEMYLHRQDDPDNDDKENDAVEAASEAGRSSIAPPEEGFQAPHHLPGGAINEDLYRWTHQNRPRPRTRRSESMHIPNTNSIDAPVGIDVLKQPGGFRRSYVLTQAAERGKAPPRALRSFVDFLMREELDEDENEDEDEDEQDVEAQDAAAGTYRARSGTGRHESSRLLQDHPVPGAIPSFRGHRRHEHRGDATVTDAVFMLLKSFVGTGILFLGKAFFNGGLLFSTVVLVTIAAISLYSFLLLVQVNQKLHLGFGDLGGALFGPHMRTAILTSIVVSQLGFVAAYTVFVAENTQSLVLSMTQCRTELSKGFLILLQGLLFLPLSLVRRITKLSWTALVADAFILAGLIYLYYYEMGTLWQDGLADVVMFNRQSFPLLIGTAVFTFEGVGLVIPITESMKEPRKFPATLTAVMAGVATLFASAGALSYAAFGSDTQTVIITNLPGQSRLVQLIQALYSSAILLSMPLQLFPALTILELGLFKRSGKYDLRTKMYKNVFRFFTVVLSMFTAWLGANDLDKFVSLIGSVACVPLCFVYPPLLHWRGCATTRREKLIDLLVFIFGVFCVVFAGSQTVHSMLSNSGPPQRPICIPPSA